MMHRFIVCVMSAATAASGVVAAWPPQSTPRAAAGTTPALITLASPLGLAIARDGAIYVSERRGHRVLRFDPAAGTVATVAGTGEPGFGGDGGPAIHATLRCPDAER